MRSISAEQPPVGTDPALAEWLTRMVTGINGSLDQVDDMETTGQMPERVFNGMRRYFTQAIAPDITEAGAWTYEEGTWVKASGGTGLGGSLVNKIAVTTTQTIDDSALFESKINIILVQTASITLTLEAASADKLVWFQKDFPSGTYTVIVP